MSLCGAFQTNLFYDIANLIFFSALPSRGTGPAAGTGKGMGDFLKRAALTVIKFN